MSTAPHHRRAGHQEVARSLTCEEPRDKGGDQRGLSATVDPREELEEQPVLCHGMDHSGHGEHGPQQAVVERD